MLSIFYTKESLFNGLKARESDACKALKARIEKPISQIGHSYGLSKYDIQIFIQDCMVEQLEQILDGRYTYQGYWVSSFTVEEIAKKRIHNFNQLQNGKATVDLVAADADKASFEAFKTDHDLENDCKNILSRMCADCQQLIKFHFYQNFCDDVVIEGKMTKYSNVKALGKARSRCYEAFIAVAAKENVFNRKLEQFKTKKEAKKNLKQLQKIENGSAT